jgi:heat shock protein HslJ
MMLQFSPILGSFLVLSGLPSVAAPTSWLDQPPQPWNRQGEALPTAKSTEGWRLNAKQCAQVIRAPQSPTERALRQRGWYLFGRAAKHNAVEIVLGTIGFDGMCRPMGYQAFVFMDGRYAGTLSPELMNARSDGSLMGDMKFTGDRTVEVKFARYRETDPLCCPSRMSRVTYQLRNGKTPSVMVTRITTVPTSEPRSTSSVEKLTGRRWQLRRIGTNQEVTLDSVFLEFDAAQQRVRGFSGCNYFNGGYRLTDHGLTFGAIASTKRACLEAPIQTIEMAFYEALGQTTRYHLAGDQLHFYGGDRLLLTFQPIP